MKKNQKIKIIIGIVIGVILSGVTSYAVAKTLIDSKDVIYTDKSELNASNVQDAIDGTCSKIDTRLSEIEDKLYTVKTLRGTKIYTSTTDVTYTGASISVPANSYCSITAKAIWSHSRPATIYISTDQNNYNTVDSVKGYSTSEYEAVTVSKYFQNAGAFYIFTSYQAEGTNRLEYDGFCATKYK